MRKYLIIFIISLLLCGYMPIDNYVAKNNICVNDKGRIVRIKENNDTLIIGHSLACGLGKYNLEYDYDYIAVEGTCLRDTKKWLQNINKTYKNIIIWTGLNDITHITDINNFKYIQDQIDAVHLEAMQRASDNVWWVSINNIDDRYYPNYNKLAAMFNEHLRPVLIDIGDFKADADTFHYQVQTYKLIMRYIDGRVHNK